MARPHGRLNLDAVVDAVAAVAGGTDRVVALGGGGDSALLLRASADVPDGHGTRAVFVAHRLESSELLAKSAARLCDDLDVELTILDVPIIDGSNLEARARDARYAALDASLRPGEVGLLGHSLDDQAETMLMRLAGGAGAAGLSGIPTRRGRWQRPLLDFGRADIRDLAADLELPWAEDSANHDHRFQRVRVRSFVVPALAEAIEGSRTGLARSADLIATDDAALTDLARSAAITVRVGMAWLPRAPLAGTHRAVASRVVRAACAMLPSPFVPSVIDVDSILASVDSGRSASLSGGRRVFDAGSHVIVGNTPEPPSPVPVTIGSPLVVADRTYVATMRGDHARLMGGGRYTVLTGSIDVDSLEVRGWRPGDRIDIGAGSTPVAELLRAAGVPAELRFVSPLLTHDGTIAAVLGVRTAAWAAAVPDEPALVLEREVDQ